MNSDNVKQLADRAAKIRANEADDGAHGEFRILKDTREEKSSFGHIDIKITGRSCGHTKRSFVNIQFDCNRSGQQTFNSEGIDNLISFLEDVKTVGFA